MNTTTGSHKLENGKWSDKSKISDIVDGSQNKDISINDQRKEFKSSLQISTEMAQKTSYNFVGKTLLAVDDVFFNLSLIEIYFKNTGAKILFASNGLEALNTCVENPQVDIVLMDIQMPVMNGLDATRAIRKIFPAKPVIAVTAFVHTADKQRCFDAGCNEFLPKPCGRDDMLKTVNDLLNSSYYPTNL